MECDTRFCHTCEEWFRRNERKRGEGPLCKKCYTAEQDRLQKIAEHEAQLESERKEAVAEEIRRKEETEKKAREEEEEEEEERLLRGLEQKEKELKVKEEWDAKKRRGELRKKQGEENERLEKERKEHERFERERKTRDEVERKARKIAIEKQKVHEKQERISKNNGKSRTNFFMLAIVVSALVVGIVLVSDDEPHLQTKVVPESIESTPSPAPSSNQKTYTNSIGMKFVLIPAGEFMMGSSENEEGRYDDEGSVHKVRISDSFYLGTYEVTQKQWREVMGDNPSYFVTTQPIKQHRSTHVLYSAAMDSIVHQQRALQFQYILDAEHI